MNGVLRTALQFYLRTRVQRWLLAVTVLAFAAQVLGQRLLCPCPAFNVWPFLLGGLTGGAGAMIAVVSAWNFRRISALRTVSLIPHARLKLAGGMFLAQAMAAAAGTVVVTLVGHAQPPTPLTWGSPRGTFEMLFGCALFFVVLLQVVTGPSRVLSVLSLALVAPLGLRVDIFMRPEFFGAPKADVLALAGILAWCLFAPWYVSTWRATPPFAAWSRGKARAPDSLSTSRETAIEAFLLGQTSLLRVCRQQLAMWMIYHVSIIASLAAMQWLMPRHRLPPNYSMAIVILLYAPVVGVNIIAGVAARGSRRLWLRAGETREVLYATTARLAWRALALLGIPLFGLAVAEMRWMQHEGIDLELPLAVCVALTPSALYLGLLNFRRRVDLSLLALYIVATGAMFAELFVESPRGKLLLWATPVVIIGFGGVLRSLARRRWFGIDWLEFRAERETRPFAVRRS